MIRRSFTPVPLLVMLGMAAFVSAICAQTSGREAELERLRDQIMVLQGRLNQVRQEATGLRGDLEQTQAALDLQRAQLAEARTARALAEESLVQIESDIADLEVRQAELRQSLRQRLIDLHRLGQEGYLRLFLSIRSEEDLLPGIRQVRFLAKRDGGLLTAYEEVYAAMAFKREELARRDLEAREWLEKEVTRAEQLERLQRRQARILAELEREDRSLSRQTAALVDKERKLANLVDFLYGRTGARLSGTPVQDFRGVLDWPVRGQVVQGFGTRLDPRYKTRVPHNGVDLAVVEGSEVKAIFPGKVLFAAPFQGYGLTVVVHHPGRVFTLYAGLQDLRVRQDQMVSLGQVLGLGTEKLYFEIREENQPVDPMQWLR